MKWVGGSLCQYSLESFNHFTGVDYDDKTGTKAIYKIQGDGKSWADDVDGENGSYDYLMFADIDHAHPEVADEFKSVSSEAC